LAEREDSRESLLRDIFDRFSEGANSTLLGLTSSAARVRNKISRVTFNLAFKSTLAVFNSPDSSHVYQVTNSYLAAFADVLENLGLLDRLTSPTVFRAIMETFPEVARIYSAQHGKTFSKAKFSALLTPIVDQTTVAKFERNSGTVKDLSTMFARSIKKDFSI
jgi:hypothetical protein